jgi:hypothetical protein
MNTELTVAVVSPEFLQDAFGNGVSVAMNDRVPHVTDLAAACYGLMCARTAPSLHDEFRHGVPHCWSVGADAVGSSAGGRAWGVASLASFEPLPEVARTLGGVWAALNVWVASGRGRAD